MFNRVEVFAATTASARDSLGERVTAYLKAFRGEIVDTVIRQSSDSEYHCLSITLLLKEDADATSHNDRARRCDIDRRDTRPRPSRARARS